MKINNLRRIEAFVATDEAKSALEDLYLFLNEIDKIVKNPDVSEAEKDKNKYKLKVIEKYIADMNNIFDEMAQNIKKENITLM